MARVLKCFNQYWNKKLEMITSDSYNFKGRKEADPKIYDIDDKGRVNRYMAEKFNL